MTTRRPVRASFVAPAAALACLAGAAPAQSLFQQAVEPAADLAPTDPAASLQGVSILLVQPPEPRKFQVHDLVTIIIEETSRALSTQSLDTEQDSTSDGSINALIDPLQLLELRLREGDLANQNIVGTDFSTEFEGEGDYQRTDRLSTRVTAEIIDIKPNGTLVLQARKGIEQNGETQFYVLSGVCRQEDITTSNTLLSTQIASLSVVIENDGEVRDAARKGWITRVFEGIFDF